MGSPAVTPRRNLPNLKDDTARTSAAAAVFPGLTRRNTEVAELIAVGLTNRAIGQRLFLSERTVEWHVDQILNRLGFDTRSQVAGWVGRSQVAVVPGPGQRRSTNLPSGLTTLLGRRHDLTALRRLLTANRLVTLVGPGGIGKTRTAVAAAEQVATAFPGGAWLCDLAPLQHADVVADALAQALGITDHDHDRLGAVRTYLKERRALLVLDNCEHLQTAAGEVAQDLLACCPALRMLATSRSSLGVRGEAVWRMLPLELNDARRLFTQRASAAAPEVDLVQTGAHETVTDICLNLDNLPLALELAAPSLRRMSLDELLSAVRLGNWQNQATGRQGSVDSVVRWSYRLLTTDEQALFTRLTVFAGWFEAEDAAGFAVGGAPVGILLGGLLEKSMLISERPVIGAVRYRMYHLMKPFARERLAECADPEAARLIHAERMLSLAERLDLRDDDEGRSGIGAKLAAMVDDLRAALETLLELRPASAASMASALEPFWLDTGRLHEGARWTAAAVALCPAPSVERCQLLFVHAHLLLRQGNEEWNKAFQEALELVDMPDCAAARGDLLLATAMIRTIRGDIEAAETAQRQAIEVFSSAESELKAARALNHLALTLLAQNRPREARELANRSVAIRRRHSTRLQVSLDTLAQVHAVMGELDQAHALFLEATALALDEQDMLTAINSLFGLALILGLRGDSEAALQLYFCADNLLPEMTGRFDEPLAPHVRKVVERAKRQLGPETVGRLRGAGKSLDASAALHLATQVS